MNGSALYAFRIPHILQDVLLRLEFEQEERSIDDVIACSLVCSDWNMQSNSLLWKECGFTFAETSRRPLLKDLLNIDANRRQHYTNFIKYLAINGPEHEWHSFSKLYQLDWQGLIGLVIGSAHFAAIELAPPILQWSLQLSFVPQNLRYMTFLITKRSRFAFTTAFFELVRRNHSSLRSLRVYEFFSLSYPNEKSDRTLSREICTSLLPYLQHLSNLEWYLNEDTMSSQAFEIVSSYQYLEEFQVKSVNDEWVRDDGSTSGLFPALRSLHCEISAESFGRLALDLKLIRKLDLTESKSSSNLWQAVVSAGFCLLEYISLILPSSLIHGEEILVITKDSPRIQLLEISASRYEGVDDSIIENLAKQLPGLKFLKLGCLGLIKSYELGNESLISLARFCPTLEECTLHAAVDWERFIHGTSPPIWPRLRMFWIFPSRKCRQKATYKDPNRSAQALLDRLPMLETVILGCSDELSHAATVGLAQRQKIR